MAVLNSGDEVVLTGTQVLDPSNRTREKKGMKPAAVETPEKHERRWWINCGGGVRLYARSTILVLGFRAGKG